MATEIEFDPADSFAVGVVGEPGHRAFYIEAHDSYRTLTMLVEKVQIQALAERAVELLQGEESGPEEAPAELSQPVQPDWRRGRRAGPWAGPGAQDDRGGSQGVTGRRERRPRSAAPRTPLGAARP